jgi:hypothetical protein
MACRAPPQLPQVSRQGMRLDFQGDRLTLAGSAIFVFCRLAFATDLGRRLTGQLK